MEKLKSIIPFEIKRKIEQSSIKDLPSTSSSLHDFLAKSPLFHSVRTFLLPSIFCNTCFLLIVVWTCCFRWLRIWQILNWGFATRIRRLLWNWRIREMLASLLPITPPQLVSIHKYQFFELMYPLINSTNVRAFVIFFVSLSRFACNGGGLVTWFWFLSIEVSFDHQCKLQSNILHLQRFLLS